MLRNLCSLTHRLAPVTLFLLAGVSAALALPLQRPLPALHDGITVSGPGAFRHDGALRIESSVTLRNLDLDLGGPIQVAAHAHLRLDHVHLRISDPPNMPNGTSGLQTLGPAEITVRESTMEPTESAHPMWMMEGKVDVDGFETKNSEFHLKHVEATLRRLRIFELEVSEGSHVTAEHLDLVFFSNHTAENEAVSFRDIPAATSFSRKLQLGSGAVADLKDARVQIFLVYVHGQSKVDLANMGRMQLALFTDCRGALTLPSGTLGKDKPVLFPQASRSDCPFRISLRNVNVDTWDVYASGNADLRLTDSVVDELTASGHAHIQVNHSSVYADWLATADDARMDVTDSTVGALRLAAQRPDLATSQVRLTGRSQASFVRDRFDCGIYVGQHATASVSQSVAPPRYEHTVESGRIMHAPAGRKN